MLYLFGKKEKPYKVLADTIVKEKNYDYELFR
jgi:hypothetical protein